MKYNNFSVILPLMLMTGVSPLTSAFQSPQLIQNSPPRTFLPPAVNHIRHSTTATTKSKSSSSQLNGKLWDKLEIDPDPLDEPPAWYLMNCIVGCEMDLLGQAKYVTRDMDSTLVEKCVVPTERHLRSHGKRNVVEVKVAYPGYCFVKMRLCAETYEALQQLPLCRSWMAGTVNLKGYKKLPPAPIALSDDEVEKFRGLEEKTEEMYKKYGEEYTGKGDHGEDLVEMYAGYEVEMMVKVLDGNFKGEDGVVRRLKDGEVMVRLYTYGNVLDQWFKPNEIRKMTDAEAMKGLGGPSAPVGQDDFDISIGKRPRERKRDLQGGRSSLRSNLMSNMGGGGDRRMRREDRVSRGEGGKRDSFGRTEQESKEEEENWRQFREEQRAQQQQKRGDMWGIKERSSASGYGDTPVGNGFVSGRQERRERNQSADYDAQASQGLEDALSGGDDDDFFASLESDLNKSLGVTPSSNANDNTGSTTSTDSDDDFFASLESDLNDSLSSTSFDTKESKKDASPPRSTKQPKPSSDDTSSLFDDDFFASLESDLNESLGNAPDHSETKKSSSSASKDNASEQDDFFASLESELDSMLSDDTK